VLPIALLFGLIFWFYRRQSGGPGSIFSFGQSPAKLFSKDSPKVSFKDVAGVDEAKKELEEVVDFLKNPKKYEAVGARTPKGVLLVGPSGTGKTLLAKAVAGEAGVPFFSMAGSEFMEMLVGVGASRARDLFATAKKAKPAIIFIDEIDAIGRTRSVGTMGGHDEREQTLNQILIEMDGFEPNESVIVIAATNRGDLLDPALLRPGRFDRRVVLDLADMEGRKQILDVHKKNKPFEDNVNWEKVARRTVGFSGADLENMLNEAAILAARQNKTKISMDDLEEAATKVKMGPQKKRLQSDLDKKMTAYHETGHAIVTHELPNMDPVHRISIVSRGMSLGHTLIPPTADRLHETKAHLTQQIAAMLGGRAAEELVFEDISTGASSDISTATQIAREMVMEYGMSSLGPINFDNEMKTAMGRFYTEPIKLSEAMLTKIDGEVKQIIDDGLKLAVSILKKNRKLLDEVSKRLIEIETMDGEEFERLMGHQKVALAKASTT
jgi:cell division protease FtsH